MLMMNIDLPNQVNEILNVLHKNNYEAYVVGGAIRDYILGIPIKDYDIATSANVSEMHIIFDSFKVIQTGLKHDTITILIDNMNIEITTYRDASKTLKGDLLLRDFTINTLAYSPKIGIIDYCNGMSDINNKIIRINGNDDGRFIEDPLRILRAIRLSSTLNFNIDDVTKDYMFRDATLLNNVAVERINDEFSKILVSIKAKYYIREYFDIITVFIPELAPLKGFPQNNPWHVYDCLEHTLVVLDNVDNNIVMRLAALFHDSGKPATYTEDVNHIGHFYDHYKVSMEISKKVLRRLKYSNDIIDRVVHLINYHDYPLTLTKKSMKKLLNYFGEKDIYNLFALKRADNLGQNPDCFSKMPSMDEALKIINDIINEQECFSPKNLKIDGKDLIEIGITDGKEIGYILGELLNLVVDESIVNEKDSLIEKAKELSKRKR
jgi:tRNA nucleotidyltransferase (CCA-adding enzyme)